MPPRPIIFTGWCKKLIHFCVFQRERHTRYCINIEEICNTVRNSKMLSNSSVMLSIMYNSIINPDYTINAAVFLHHHLHCVKLLLATVDKIKQGSEMAYKSSINKQS